MATKSVQRTLEYLRNDGFTVAVVEHWNPYTKHRQDLFGFIDILAVSKEKGIIGVQACGADWSGHVSKMQIDCKDIIDQWVASGGRVWLIGWRKLKAVKADGTKGKAMRWVPRLADWSAGKLEEKEEL